jgi:hypothetical protein
LLSKNNTIDNRYVKLGQSYGANRSGSSKTHRPRLGDRYRFCCAFPHHRGGAGGVDRPPL